ncbi:hypothetical protein H7X69_00080, partial [Candidatus Saccharibacteria bacterium]|nr:hypothetical protein [Candidatus Saccharibacteria bacterium]
LAREFRSASLEPTGSPGAVKPSKSFFFLFTIKKKEDICYFGKSKD